MSRSQTAPQSTAPASLAPASEPDDELRARAYQGYLRGLRTVWKGDVYRSVLADARALGDRDPAGIERAMRASSPDYRLYGWLERHLQQFKYFGRYGMVTQARPQAAGLARRLDEAARSRPEQLVLDASLALPDYYVEADFHQHAGGIWSDDYDAFVYEAAADRYSFALQDSSKPYVDFARHVLEQGMADGSPIRSVLDLGCGFGKSTLPFARLDPSLRVEGIDLSAPCLRLAHLRALDEGLDVRFAQCAAEALPHADESLDAVVCYWLLHELPAEVARAVFDEAMRVLRPGGLFASRDMHTCTGGAVGRFLHYGHAVRNREPFLPDCSLDTLQAGLAEAGFVECGLHPCDPRTPGLESSEPLSNERLHVNTVLQARKPVR